MKLLKDKEIGLVRADSGFYSNNFLRWFEKRDLNYLIAVKFYQNIRFEICKIEKWVEIFKARIKLIMIIILIKRYSI